MEKKLGSCGLAFKMLGERRWKNHSCNKLTKIAAWWASLSKSCSFSFSRSARVSRFPRSAASGNSYLCGYIMAICLIPTRWWPSVFFVLPECTSCTPWHCGRLCMRRGNQGLVKLVQNVLAHDVIVELCRDVHFCFLMRFFHHCTYSRNSWDLPEQNSTMRSQVIGKVAEVVA